MWDSPWNCSNLSCRLLETIAMSTLTLKIPEGILSAIRQSAVEAGVSVDQFVSSAAGEKLASWRSLDWLRKEAAQGNRADFEKFLGAVPEIKPLPGDELPR
jgi:hypothetical protein